MVLSDIYEIDPENIMAIGDSYNDAMMLAWAGTGVAMGNADPALKQLARYVTQDCDHDGVAQAVYHIFRKDPPQGNGGGWYERSVLHEKLYHHSGSRSQMGRECAAGANQL